MKTINIVDLDNLLHIGAKAGHGKNFNVGAFPTGGLYNVFRNLKNMGVLLNEPNKKLVVVYDKGTSLRKDVYPEYKAHRKNKSKVELLKDKGVQLQKEVIVEALQRAGFLTIGLEGMEADDLMFNLVYKLAVDPTQPLEQEDGLTVVVHTSDQDWIGATGVSGSVLYKGAVRGNKLTSGLNDFNAFYNKGENPYHCYIKRAMFGDSGDGYNGFGREFMEVLGKSPEEVYRYPEVQQGLPSMYWNAYFFKKAFQERYNQYPELLQSIYLQMDLAFPIMNEKVYGDGLNLIELLDKPINLVPIKELLETLRIKILEDQLGNLGEFNGKVFNTFRNKYEPKYTDVFEYFKSIEYLPKQLITTEQVDIAFGLVD